MANKKKPDRGQCYHCKSDGLLLVTLYRPRVQHPCADGIHENYQPGKIIYTRKMCGECGLICDFEATPQEIASNGDIEMQAASVQYASQVRAMHADLLDHVEQLQATATLIQQLVATDIAQRQLADEEENPAQPQIMGYCNPG